MGTSWRLLAVLPLAALAIAGCGGGGDDGSTTAATTEASAPAALSKAEVISQGDAICAEVNSAVGAAGSTSADAGEAVVQVAGLYGGMVERLKGLGPPREESAGYSEFIASAEALAQAESNLKLAYEREEAEELTSASTEVSSAVTEFESSAAEFGFEKCAESPTAPAPTGSAAGEESGGEESAGGFEAEGAEEVAPEEAEVTPEEAPPVEEESAGGGAGVGGGTEGGGSTGTEGSSGGIGPG